MNDQKKDVQKQEAPKTIEGAQGGNTSSWKRLLGKKSGCFQQRTWQQRQSS